MQIHLNGQQQSVPDEHSIAALLEGLALETRHVAVEVNHELVPRAQHGQYRLKPGDRVEIVTLVGGG